MLNPGFKYIEKFRVGIQWFKMDSKEFISNISFESKNDNGDIVSCNCQSKTFRLTKEQI